MTTYSGRVLTLKDGSRIPYVTNGSYAHIFIDQNAGKVYKLSVSTPENTLSYTPKAKVDEIRRENYDTQVDAYTLAAKDEYLAKHVPQFLGVADVASDDKTGKDVSNEYLLSCCYAVQRIEGKDEKLNPLADDTPAHVKGFVDRCWAVGIKYTKDASVFNGNDPDRFLVIDFGTREIDMPA